MSHFSIRCDSQPFRNRSLHCSLADAIAEAFLISEECFHSDREQWGESRVHVVTVMHHDSWTVAAQAAFRG